MCIITILSIIFLDIILFSALNYTYIKIILSLIINIFQIYFLVRLLIIVFRKNGVYLSKNSLVIQRKIIYHFRFTDIIYYKNIKSCDYFQGNIESFRYSENDAVLWYNRNSLVQIEDENSKKYFVPVKDSDYFIKEVNQRIIASKKNNE